VLSPGHEIGPADIPAEIRDAGSRFLPVHVGPIVRGRDGVEGREIEFIVRSLVELKLQVEELRRRTEPPAIGHGASVAFPGLLGGGAAAAGGVAPPRTDELFGQRPDGGAGPGNRAVVGIEAPGAPPPPNVVVVRPGMTMAEIERAAIEAALREMRGNRRKAAEALGIGERTLYRKLQEYHILDTPELVDPAAGPATSNVPTNAFG